MTETQFEAVTMLAADATIHERMVQVLGDLPAIGKDSRNQQQQFNYRSHDDVLNALNPLLARHGIYVVPRVLERETGERATRSGGVLYEVNLLVEYTFYGLRGDSIVASAWGEGTDSGDKSTNKAMTMAMKAVLAQAFAISVAENQDADGQSPEPTTGRGGRDRPERTEFDPALDWLPDAIRGDDMYKRIGQALTGIDPTIDWQETLKPLLVGVFGVEAREDVPADSQPEFWRRLSNAVAKVGDNEPFGDDEKIVDAFAWAFQGVRTNVVVEGKIADAEALLAEEAAAAAASDA